MRFIKRIRTHTYTLIGGALLVIALDGCIAVFRLIGLPKGAAIYAGALSFFGFASFVARRYFKPQPKPHHEKDHDNG